MDYELDHITAKNSLISGIKALNKHLKNNSVQHQNCYRISGWVHTSKNKIYIFPELVKKKAEIVIQIFSWDLESHYCQNVKNSYFEEFSIEKCSLGSSEFFVLFEIKTSTRTAFLKTDLLKMNSWIIEIPDLKKDLVFLSKNEVFYINTKNVLCKILNSNKIQKVLQLPSKTKSILNYSEQTLLIKNSSENPSIPMIDLSTKKLMMNIFIEKQNYEIIKGIRNKNSIYLLESLKSNFSIELTIKSLHPEKIKYIKEYPSQSRCIFEVTNNEASLALAVFSLSDQKLFDYFDVFIFSAKNLKIECKLKIKNPFSKESMYNIDSLSLKFFCEEKKKYFWLIDKKKGYLGLYSLKDEKWINRRNCAGIRPRIHTFKICPNQQKILLRVESTKILIICLKTEKVLFSFETNTLVDNLKDPLLKIDFYLEDELLITNCKRILIYNFKEKKIKHQINLKHQVVSFQVLHEAQNIIVRFKDIGLRLLGSNLKTIKDFPQELRKKATNLYHEFSFKKVPKILITIYTFFDENHHRSAILTAYSYSNDFKLLSNFEINNFCFNKQILYSERNRCVYIESKITTELLIFDCTKIKLKSIKISGVQESRTIYFLREEEDGKAVFSIRETGDLLHLDLKRNISWVEKLSESKKKLEERFLKIKSNDTNYFIQLDKIENSLLVNSHFKNGPVSIIELMKAPMPDFESNEDLKGWVLELTKLYWKKEEIEHFLKLVKNLTILEDLRAVDKSLRVFGYPLLKDRKSNVDDPLRYAKMGNNKRLLNLLLKFSIRRKRKMVLN